MQPAHEKDPALRAINVSLGFDRRLWREDLEGSLAHVRMLADRGILTRGEADRILEGLARVRAELEAGTFPFREELEDIHLNIEARLTELVGPVGGKLHTGRSRNDQVATDLRLFLRRELGALDARLASLGRALLEAAGRELEAGTVLPFYTHLQRAQPVLLAHHLLAHLEALERDRARFADAGRRADESPLGAGAGAGSGFPVDPEATARALGFGRAMRNSLDAVAARDFVAETLSAASILMAHLSRVAEEMILWSTAEFGFVRLSDAVTTGSSIMPQKRNPDGAELVRGKAGRVFGRLSGFLATMKALPLAYNKDLQEDKEAVFEVLDTVALALAATEATIRGATFDRARMRAAAEERAGYANATELADRLALAGMPFREAHGVAAALVARARAEGKSLSELPLDVLRAHAPLLDASIYETLTVEAALRRRAATGGTAPERVREALEAARRRFGERP